MFGNGKFLVFGNAIIDILSSFNESDFAKLKAPKGSMKLVTAEEALLLSETFPRQTIMSGGSAANTAFSLKNFGAEVEFFGKVRDDEFGKIYINDMQQIGVKFINPPATKGDPTACCFIAVTPDSQRTMQTYLGIAPLITVNEVERIKFDAEYVYIEGYLWDREETKQAILVGLEKAKANGAKICLTLSDRFCVERHLESFKEIIAKYVNILFCNYEEAKAFTGCNNIHDTLSAMKQTADYVIVTASALGSYSLGRKIEGCITYIPDTVKPVDSTGAGDAYAAGFLYNFTLKRDVKASMEIGSKLAAHVICKMGARPSIDLRKLI